MLKITPDTWLISDTHFGHDNIIKYCDRPANHEEIILANWLDLIGEDDTVLHLGDVWFGKGTDAAKWSEEIANTLPGKKYLILGNHDRANTHYYRDAGFTLIKPFIQDGIAFTHYPMHDRNGEVVPGKPIKPIKPKYFPPCGQDWDTNIHGHVHNNKPHDSGIRMGTLKRYLNISVEVVDYKPVRLGDICTLLPTKEN